MIKKVIQVSWLSLSLSIMSCASQQQLFTTTLAGDRLERALREHVAGVTSADREEAVETTGECEVFLTIKTYDGALFSRPTCIKRPGVPHVEIPERIALDKHPKILVNEARYCEQDPEEAKIGASGTARLCVWNREFDDRYPMTFVLSTEDKTALGERVALVRVIRNGRSVFTWKNKQPLVSANRLEIPGRIVAAPEYFRQPVELGLYVLPTGAEIAVANVDDVLTMPNWTARLTSGLSAIMRASVPEAVRSDVECLRQRFLYSQAVINRNEEKRREAVAEMARLDAESRSLNVAISEAYSVVAATDSELSEENAQGVIDGVPLAANDVVLFLDPAGHARIRVFVAAGTKWGRLSDADVKRIATFVDAQGKPNGDRLVKIGSGHRNKDRFYALRAWSKGDEAPRVDRVRVPAQGCAAPSQALEAAHEELESAVKRAVVRSSGPSLSALSARARDLATRLGVTLEDARRAIETRVAELPAEERAEISRSTEWLRTIGEVSAQAVEGAQGFANSAREIEATIKESLNDPDAQLRAYQAFASTLPTDESLFSRAVTNPEPTGPEARLSMGFYRPRQHYFLLAWNALPFPITSDTRIKVEPRIENLIPIIDIYGVLWQTNNPFVQTIGSGIGVMGLRESVEEPEYTTAFNLGLQANFSINFLRVGIAYVVREADHCSSACLFNHQNFRFLLGADLFRLVTGKNAAVTQGTATQSLVTE